MNPAWLLFNNSSSLRSPWHTKRRPPAGCITTVIQILSADSHQLYHPSRSSGPYKPGECGREGNKLRRQLSPLIPLLLL